jgi:superfamily II DNA or RNA helicase
MPNVEIKVFNCHAEIDGELQQGEIDTLGRALSYTQANSRYSFAYKSGHWDGRVRLLNRQLQFPAGLVDEVVRVLAGFGIVPQVTDCRKGISHSPVADWQGHPLRDYQQRAVERALDVGRGTMKMATGAGKTTVIAALCGAYNTQTVVYVVSLDLLTQVKETIETCLGIPVGLVGGGNCSLEKITVCSVWSAAAAYNTKDDADSEEDVAEDKWSPSDEQKKNIRDMVEAARLVILDESQFAAAASIQAIMKNSKSAANRFGFSGTPWRSDGADILLTAAFGGNIVDIRASDLIELGWLVEPRIAFRDIPADFKLPKKWADVKKAYIVENEVRNHLLVQNTCKLLDLGRKPLLLFRDIKHGRMLEEMLPDGIRYEMVTGALAMDERERIKSQFKAGKIDLVLASSVFDQGIDLPALDALVLAGGGKSTAKALQRIGRVIRAAPGKTDALVLETWDQSHFVKKHSSARYEAYRLESRFKISAGPEMQATIGKK